MTNVIPLARHRMWLCSRDKPDCAGCIVCEGGLGYCAICGSGEAGMPTDCPGERMSVTQVNCVAAGALDYRRGRGWFVCEEIQSGGVA